MCSCQPRVLLVDDEPRFLAAIRRLLSQDCALMTAGSVVDAHRLLAVFPFDVVITGFGVGEDCGLHVLERARSRQPWARRILSSAMETEAVDDALSTDLVQTWLPKPVTYVELQRCLRESTSSCGLSIGRSRRLDQ